MKKIRILSIDGGGIRGVIPGVILSYVERQLQAKDHSDRKIGDYFDFIAGTSTGGILACAYLIPGPDGHAMHGADDAVNIYLKEGGDIFHRDLMKKIVSGFGLLDEKYDATELEKDLGGFFGEAMLRDFIKPCLIAAYEITARKAHFFNSAQAAEPLYNFKVSDVARATSAAPTYFEPAQIHSVAGQAFSLIDGGVFANNPALCAYAEVRKMEFSKLLGADKPDLPSAKDMLIVSLGTGTVKNPYYYKDFKNAGELKWLQPIIDILMSGNAETVDYQLMQMYKTLNVTDQQDYYRLEPSLREALPDMDVATPLNLENLRQAGLWFIDQNKPKLDEMIDKLLVND
ncbi:MAG TPA: patatin-like phospholipase family protein [Chitinophagaceae bacterium]|jgi:patatin-like phospholipase/acyl hydrolase|nr:patatin-like phospholipase family protein [Chitinophagaceae bacterium]